VQRIEVDVPGWVCLRLEHLVLDVNGTLAMDGGLIPAVADRLEALGRQVDCHLISADTYGRLDAIAADLGVRAVRLDRGVPEAVQKAAFVRSLGAARVVAVGNGANDIAMLREAALGIAVLGPEGLAMAALNAADVLTGSIEDALDLLLKPQRLVATLRR
jgi:soluble P-type ATPase